MNYSEAWEVMCNDVFPICVAQNVGTLEAVLFGQLSAAAAASPMDEDFTVTREELCSRTGMKKDQFVATLKSSLHLTLLSLREKDFRRAITTI